MLSGNFFGTVLVIWSQVRLPLARVEPGRCDAFGRLAFSAWMIHALARGQGR